jgi:hypothetical protein
MLNRRRLTLLAFVLTLLLAPGLSQAKPAHSTSGHHSVRKAGCGIDPNGCPLGGSTTNSGGH